MYNLLVMYSWASVHILVMCSIVPPIMAVLVMYCITGSQCCCITGQCYVYVDKVVTRLSHGCDNLSTTLLAGAHDHTEKVSILYS